MDILNLDKPLRTADPVVQVQTGLGMGVYDVELVIVDEAGQTSTAEISFEIQGRVIVRPPIDVNPVVTPVVTPVVRPVVVNPVVVRPVVTPATPVTPTPRAPAKRPAIKKPKPSDPTE